MPKDSTGFDLGVGVAILAATRQMRGGLEHTALVGELGLEDDMQPGRGIIGKILVGKLQLRRTQRRCSP